MTIDSNVMFCACKTLCRVYPLEKQEIEIYVLLVKQLVSILHREYY